MNGSRQNVTIILATLVLSFACIGRVKSPVRGSRESLPSQGTSKDGGTIRAAFPAHRGLCPPPGLDDPNGGLVSSSVSKLGPSGQVVTKQFAIHLPRTLVSGVRPVCAEVFFSEWPRFDTCGAPECDSTEPWELRTTHYRLRRQIDDPEVLDRLWSDYVSVRATPGQLPFGACEHDARIMVVFYTPEPDTRWVAAGVSCRTMMLTDDLRLHEKDGPVLREMAEALGVREEMEKAVPGIWLPSPVAPPGTPSSPSTPAVVAR